MNVDESHAIRSPDGSPFRQIAVGLRHLPGVARRLHHSRELGRAFDFLTWFEYPPEASGLSENLVGTLRATPEWRFVDQEVDIRLSLLSP
jgi:hypothetical protein